MTQIDTPTSDDIEAQLKALKSVREDDVSGPRNALDKGIVKFGGVFSFLFAIAAVEVVNVTPMLAMNTPHPRQ